MCASAMAGSPSPTRVPRCGRTPRCRRGPASSCAGRRGYRPRRPYAHRHGACRLPVRPRARSGGEGGRRGPGRGWDRLLTGGDRPDRRVLPHPPGSETAAARTWDITPGGLHARLVRQQRPVLRPADAPEQHRRRCGELRRLPHSIGRRPDRPRPSPAPTEDVVAALWHQSAGRSSPTWRSCRSGLRADHRAPDHPCGYATRFPAARRSLVRRGQPVAGPTGLTRRYYSRN